MYILTSLLLWKSCLFLLRKLIPYTFLTATLQRASTAEGKAGGSSVSRTEELWKIIKDRYSVKINISSHWLKNVNSQRNQNQRSNYPKIWYISIIFLLDPIVTRVTGGGSNPLKWDERSSFPPGISQSSQEASGGPWLVYVHQVAF